MQAVLISIQPGWCELIASGKKTVEVRKTMPLLPAPFKAYIYETKDPHYENLGYCWEKGKCFVAATASISAYALIKSILRALTASTDASITIPKKEPTRNGRYKNDTKSKAYQNC